MKHIKKTGALDQHEWQKVVVINRGEIRFPSCLAPLNEARSCLPFCDQRAFLNSFRWYLVSKETCFVWMLNPMTWILLHYCVVCNILILCPNFSFFWLLIYLPIYLSFIIFISNRICTEKKQILWHGMLRNFTKLLPNHYLIATESLPNP